MWVAMFWWSVRPSYGILPSIIECSSITGSGILTLLTNNDGSSCVSNRIGLDMMPFRHDYYTCLYIVVSNITVLAIATFGQFGVSDPGNWFDSPWWHTSNLYNFLHIIYCLCAPIYSVMFFMYRDLVVKILAIHHWG